MRLIRKNEVKKHINENDCWIIAHNKVYDVSKYMNIHPGSKKAILNKAGQDVSYDFDFHSKKSREIWEKLCIGYTEDYVSNSTCCVIS